MPELLDQLRQFKLLPIVTMDRVEHAAALADVLVRGRLPIVEVTLRTRAAVDCVRAIADRGDVMVGAGTILSTELADAAIDAGAQFLVAPGTNPKIIEHVLRRGQAMIPGIATPSEIELALTLGVRTLKFFPAEALGGVRTLTAYNGPFPDVDFVPTGSITPELMPGYLAIPSVAACGGSWIAPRDLLSAGRFDAIACLVEDARKLLTPPPDVAT